ncbi:MAG: polysaccharide pyruvyl transferase CsaB [Candidatus Obscuribacterales bacterium]|nr:polysaccharide pyruvyl transferase CsaB [Candidatus Obscuribacterales bacterium]
MTDRDPKSLQPVLESSGGRRLVLVCGYYGFGNLGDEAILEELLLELRELAAPSDIVVLSNDPETTSARFGIASINRWHLKEILSLLFKTRLFVSGGGGLFQDSSSIKSVVYYSFLLSMARMMGARTIVYAQGIGPLKSLPAIAMTKAALSTASAITVRDQKSQDLLSSWNLSSILSADPVWCLKPSLLPDSIQDLLESCRIGHCQDTLIVGLSLRKTAGFADDQALDLARLLLVSLPQDALLVPLILQENQDRALLDRVVQTWLAQGRKSLDLPTDLDLLPSQWLSLIGRLDLVIGMRLHSLIMALKSGVMTVGLAYDPKVEHVMIQFGQPFLNIVNQNCDKEALSGLPKLVNEALARRQELCDLAQTNAKSASSLACQNFQVLDKILSIQEL